MWFSSKEKNNNNRIKRRRDITRSPVYTLHARASDRRNQGMHKAGIIALSIVALGGLVWVVVQGWNLAKQKLFSRNEIFIIQTIEASSTGKLTAAHLKEYGGFFEGVNLFDIDLNAIRKRLEDVPVIRDAEVQRRLPSTLYVRVSERVPLARIPQGQAGFFFSIDRDGKVLGLAGSQFQHLPVITGFSDKGISPGSSVTDNKALDALNLVHMLDASPAQDVVRLKRIDVGNPDYLDCVLDSGVKVLMPRNVSEKKIEDLVTVLRESGGRHTSFDLTLEGRIPAT